MLTINLDGPGPAINDYCVRPLEFTFHWSDLIDILSDCPYNDQVKEAT